MDFLWPSPKRGDVAGFTLTSVRTDTNGHIENQPHKKRGLTAGTSTSVENVPSSELEKSGHLPAPGSFGLLSPCV